MPTRRELANAIRFLSIDAVEQAQSGHPGMPMGMADIAEVLWQDFLRHNPKNPSWPNRDRFVLSNGHGSMLLYSLLHLTGYDVTLDDLKQFRQLHSRTAGHPEFGITPGVETTTGPLGQGISNAVGMALAERLLAKQFNREQHEIVNHHTYAFIGDGCLMEGISHEVCSLAGTLGLGKLIVLWDDNHISIDGKVEGWFTDDTAKRFEAYNWQVIANVDGHNADEIAAAITAAQNNTAQPTLICCKTTIGFGSPNLAGTAKTHGAPLGTDEIAATRQALNWEYPAFEIPEAYYSAWNADANGEKLEQQWQQTFADYQQAHPELAAEFLRRIKGELPSNFKQQCESLIQHCHEQAATTATRKASLNVLNALAPQLPELVGGSADLTGSNCTRWQDATTIQPDTVDGNYLYYGVREFGMSAIMNGMALHGGIIPFGGTFLTFTDYARNAVRMAALMQQRVTFVYSHDSIGLGEDGPTHQPIEHINMLRMTPNVEVWRPADTVETAVAWQAALENHKQPTCLLLTRQNVPHCERTPEQIQKIALGGYTLVDTDSTPNIILIATGSEVQLACEAAEQLAKKNIAARVVSMPCTERFLAQDSNYQDSVLPPHVTQRIAIEAGSTAFWYRFVGLAGRVIGIDSFGESAPAELLYEHFGITTQHIIETAQKLVNGE